MPILRRNRQRRIYTPRRKPNNFNNNEDTLNRIMTLPRQENKENPLVNGFFNGTSFHSQQINTSLIDHSFNETSFHPQQINTSLINQFSNGASFY
ncbi:unnamed protein product [Rhizophagus irregularis]|nr:unnamed protein product [Rhizophagus irregularis]CAB5378520.1 unnamed protein product [Rhizophagus irregularis]